MPTSRPFSSSRARKDFSSPVSWIVFQCLAIFWTESRICASVCLAVMKIRTRVSFSGTAGYKIGWALIPSWNRASDSRSALTLCPVIKGTIAVPWAMPVSMPASRASSRKSFALLCSLATNSGCSFKTRSAPKAAPTFAGGIPAANT